MRTLLRAVLPALALLSSISASAQDVSMRAVVEREVLVMFRDGAVALPVGRVEGRLSETSMQPALRALLRDAGADELRRGLPGFQKADTLRVLANGRTLRTPDYTNLFVIALPAGRSREALVAQLEALPSVVYAEINQTAQTREAPADIGPVDPSRDLLGETMVAAQMPPERIPINEPRFGDQWGLRNLSMPNVDIEATQAWVLTTGSSSNIVGVVDGLVFGNHPDLAGKVNIGTGNGEHGTQVAGIIAARGENPGGYVVGVDWLARIHSVPLGDLLTTAQSITDAVTAGARVINNSWGYAQQSATLTQALRSANGAGVLLVHANPYDTGGPDAQSNYPNNVGPWILNVGAMTATGGVCCNSGTRSFTDVAGPGGNILTTSTNGSVAYNSGTSFSAPFVAGTASLLRSANASLRTYDIEHVITRTAREYPVFNQQRGYGMINAHEAVRRVSAPFVVQHGAASFPKLHTNVQRTFTASPGNGVAAGTYWVDVYKMEATPSYSFGQMPWGVWLAPTARGLSGANPNNGQPYLYESIGPTSATLNTFFYWVRTNSTGQTVNRWVPFDPTAFQCNAGTECTGTYEYTVIGQALPLSVSFSGPYQVTRNTQATWQSTISGGAAPYARQWHFNVACPAPPPCTGNICTHGGEVDLPEPPAPSAPDDGPCGVWQDGGTASSFTKTFYSSSTSSVVIRLTATDAAGASGQYSESIVVGSSAGLTAGEGALKAAGYETAFEGVYPNPLGSDGTVGFTLAEPLGVRVTMYDALGREVARLADGSFEAGAHAVSLNGRALPSGVYVVRMEAGTFSAMRRVSIVR